MSYRKKGNDFTYDMQHNPDLQLYV